MACPLPFSSNASCGFFGGAVGYLGYDVISQYAPKQLSPEEVKKVIEEKFADVIATKNKGAIMKAVMGELKGKADGKVINQVVADLCK